MKRLLICIVLFALFDSAQAQKVFKCTDSNGNVTFSQQECGKDAQQVMDNLKRSV